MLRAGLSALEVPYGLAVRRRNRWYDRHTDAAVAVGVPVVSVGNLTVGGTGKTPVVEWLVRWFAARDVRAGIVSRGYRSEDGLANDEALELAIKLPGTPHVQNPDRVAASRQIVEEHGCKAIVLDDGYQHRRIHRDVNIALVDATAPFGYDRLLPRGLLREPLAGLARADVVILTRADAISPEEREAILRRLREYAPQAMWLEAAHQPKSLLAADGRRAEVATLAGQPVAAFCGIGNPAGFRHTLEHAGLRVADFREFPDHYAYSTAAVAGLSAWANGTEVAAVVCTLKDLVKTRVTHLARKPLWAVEIAVEFLGPTSLLEERLAKLISPPPQ
ncbi:MAG: tetraacyldisaccharide 4'-kinase [Planctomycetota bacterium]